MKQLFGFVLFGLLCSSIPLLAQDIHQLLTAIRQKQAGLNGITYTLDRTDTLVTGTVRHLSGQVQIRLDPTDRPFGFWFRSRQDDLPGEVIYDGRVGYETDDGEKTYTLLLDSMQIRNLLYRSAGRIVIPDLVHLDTTQAVRSTLSQDTRYYYITLYYADIEQYDVTKRYKAVRVDRATLLPTSIRQHQETLGKVQDLFYDVKSIVTNDTVSGNTFHEPSFLATYDQKLPTPNRKKPVLGLTGQSAPSFRLSSLTGDSLASTAFLGKITLLDFWEVWCGPCVASMPKVEQLHHKYADRGFQVYGITHEISQLDAVRRLIASRSIHFPTLIGTDQVRSDYKLVAIPLYVLIDRQGTVRYVCEGYSEEIDRSIQQLLQE